MKRNLKSSRHPSGAGDKSNSDLGNVRIGEFWLFLGPKPGDMQLGRWISGNHAAPNGLVAKEAEHCQLHFSCVVRCISGAPFDVVHAVPVLEFLRALDSALSQISAEVVPDKDNPAPGAGFAGIPALDVSRDPAVPEIPVRTPAVLLKAGLVTFCSGLAGMCRNLVPKRPERFTAPDAVSAAVLEVPEGAARITKQ